MRLPLCVLALVALTACTPSDDERPARTPPPSPSLSSPAPPTASPSASASAPPLAQGSGAPRCPAPCVVQHRLTRAFLPGRSGEQTLQLSRSEQADEDGSNLHASLVDAQGRVLWEERGFGWEWRPVDDRFAIRFDDAGNVFFRAYVADFTYLYVLNVAGDGPRLVGAAGEDPRDGFQLGEVVERRGSAAFDVVEEVVDCPAGEEDVLECPTSEVRYRWDGRQYVRA